MVFNIDGWRADMTVQRPAGRGDDRSLAALIDRFERAYQAFVALARRGLFNP